MSQAARKTPSAARMPATSGLRGSIHCPTDRVKAASQAYRTYYKAQNPVDDFYFVDHTTHTYLTLPGHGFATYFRQDTPAEEMAERTACFIDNA